MSEQIQPPIDNIAMIKNIVAWIGTALAIGLKITPSVLFYKIFMKICTPTAIRTQDLQLRQGEESRTLIKYTSPLLTPCNLFR